MNNQDAASKAVDAISAGADRIADAIEKVAPPAWRALVLAERVQSIGIAVALLAAMAACVVLALIAWPRMGKESDTGWEPVCFISVLVGCVLFIASCFALPRQIADVVAPEAAVIRSLMPGGCK